MKNGLFWKGLALGALLSASLPAPAAGPPQSGGGGGAGNPSTSYWNLFGNPGLDPATQFLGTTDLTPLIFKVANEEIMRLHTNGQIGIGTVSPSDLYMVDVAGYLHALELYENSLPLASKYALIDGTNASLQIIPGIGLSGGGPVSLSGQVQLNNTGLLSLTANGPLSVTAGQNPSLSLGVVPISLGGTGLSEGPASLNQFLRSNGSGAWIPGDIHISDLPSLAGLYASVTGENASGTWPISVTGNAATVTNGVYTTASYADPSWLTALSGSKITGQVASAAQADTATNADHAAQADNATNAAQAANAAHAVQADNATTADSATNAAHAAQADNATNAQDAVNAQNATNAQNAANAENAVNAQNAQHALQADNATNAENAANAAHAAQADNATNATNAQNAANAENATNAQNAVNAQSAVNAQNAVNAQTAAVAGTISSVLPVEKGGTGSSTQNFVDLTGNQAIGGTKSFSGQVGIGTDAPNGLLEVKAAPAMTQLDQTSNVPGASQGYGYTYGNNTFWQSFKAGIAGNLTRVVVATPDPHSGVMSICEGTGPCATPISQAPFSAPAGTTDVTFSAPATMVPGQTYTWVITSDTAMGSITWYYDNPYPDGKASNDYRNMDYIFTTYVSTPEKAFRVDAGTADTTIGGVLTPNGGIQFSDGLVTSRAELLGQVGPQGETGPQGPQGIQGIQGEIGPVGPAGPQGPQGAKGDTGATGTTGAVGPQGAVGATGPAGPVGPQGATGATGPAGSQGPQGPAGPVGATGPAGPQGPQGPAGVSGVVGVVSAGGYVGSSVGGTGVWGFAGPTATVNVTAGQKLFISAHAAIGLSTAGPTPVLVGIGWQSSNGGGITVDNSYFLIPEATNRREIQSASYVLSNLPTGTYNVGFVVQSTVPFTNNDFNNVVVMVLN